MPEPSYPCHRCGQRIEDMEHPVVIYTVAGLAPMHPLVRNAERAADITDYPLPANVRELLSQPVTRREWCVGCYAEEHGVALVDQDGNVVAKPDQARAYLQSGFVAKLEAARAEKAAMAPASPPL